MQPTLASSSNLAASEVVLILGLLAVVVFFCVNSEMRPLPFHCVYVCVLCDGGGGVVALVTCQTATNTHTPAATTQVYRVYGDWQFDKNWFLV